MVASAERKIKHKKRHGQHQRHSKGFLRVYSPYLPLLMSIAVSLVFIFNSPVHTSGAVQSASSGISAGSLLNATNKHRLNSGKPELAQNDALWQAAQSKANDMVSQNYWSHDTPNGESPWVFVEKAKYDYTKASENLAYGFSNSRDVVAGWMNSEQHREAMLNTEYEDVGFGLANSSNYNGQGPQQVIVAFYGTTGPLANNNAYGVSHVKAASSAVRSYDQFASYSVSRIQVATDGIAPVTTSILIIVALLGAVLLGSRHFLALRRLLFKEGRYVINNPLIDVTLIAIILAGVALTGTAGLIR